MELRDCQPMHISVSNLGFLKSDLKNYIVLKYVLFYNILKKRNTKQNILCLGV